MPHCWSPDKKFLVAQTNFNFKHQSQKYFPSLVFQHENTSMYWKKLFPEVFQIPEYTKNPLENFLLSNSPVGPINLVKLVINGFWVISYPHITIKMCIKDLMLSLALYLQVRIY